MTPYLKEEIEKIPGGINTVTKCLKVSRATIYNWINKGNIPANKLEQLIKLGVDAQYIFTGQTQKVSISLPPPEQFYEQMNKLKLSQIQEILIKVDEMLQINEMEIKLKKMEKLLEERDDKENGIEN